MRNNDDIKYSVWIEVTATKALEKTLQALREGLNVRKKTVRPEKIFSTSLDVTDPRKRARLVTGHVAVEPLNRFVK